MTLTFNIDPCPAPRMTRSDRWKKRPVVMRYFGFRDAAKLQARVFNYKLSGHLEIIFHMAMPSSWSKSKKEKMVGQPCLVRPDIDNLVKAWCDSMESEDNYVWSINAKKVWANEGKIEVII